MLGRDLFSEFSNFVCLAGSSYAEDDALKLARDCILTGKDSLFLYLFHFCSECTNFFRFIPPSPAAEEFGPVCMALTVFEQELLKQEGKAYNRAEILDVSL